MTASPAEDRVRFLDDMVRAFPELRETQLDGYLRGKTHEPSEETPLGWLGDSVAEYLSR